MVTRQSLSESYRTMAHLRRFFESVRRTITAEPTEGGLTPAQQFALLTLAGNPFGEPLTIGDLARQTFATINTTSALVRRMERAGLVRTRRSSRPCARRPTSRGEPSCAPPSRPGSTTGAPSSRRSLPVAVTHAPPDRNY